MIIEYDERHDLLYIRLDERDQQLRNVRVDDSIVLDVGSDDRVVGIEILEASKRVDLNQLATLEFRKTA